MSPSGQRIDPPTSTGAIFVAAGTLPKDHWFDRHEHSVHQLVWASAGVLSVRIEAGTWVLPPSLALLVPVGTPHATGATAPSAMVSSFLDPARCPIEWTRPTTIGVSRLLAELIGYLATTGLSAEARARAEDVLFDLLTPVEVAEISLPLPEDPRALAVARALLDDPADDRTLAEWGRVVGASERTLARLFVTQTRLPFGRWRAQLRLRAALPMLAEGRGVASVAGRVGYASPSAFVAAFRRTIGVTPGDYFGLH